MKIATVTLNPAIDRNILYDLTLKTGELNRIEKVKVNAGGKGINVSRMLKKLGENSYIYGLNGGYNGKMIVEMLKEEGIESHFTPTKAETRMNIKITDNSSKETEINEMGGPVSNDELEALIETLKKSDAQIFIIGGSTPKPLESDTVKKITAILKSRGKIVICDVSGEPLKKAVEAKPYLIKPNREEFCSLIGFTPKDEEYEQQAIRFYNETGVEIILTLGKRGAIYSGRAGNWIVKNPEIKPKGFTGAGDTFLASYVYMLVNEAPFDVAFKFASAASLSKVELEGTEMPEIDHIMSNLSKVTVKQI